MQVRTMRPRLGGISFGNDWSLFDIAYITELGWYGVW